MLTALLLTLATAAPPLPDYQEEAIVGAWTELDTRITAACVWPPGLTGLGPPLSCDDTKLKAALSRGLQLVRDLADDGRFHYLIALTHRHLGDVRAAEASLRDCLSRRPDRAEAWYDLGEILAARSAWTEAAEAFVQVTKLRPNGPVSWPGWLQLAQARAHLHDAPGFEDALREALRWGFDLRTIAGQPAWKAFYADPALRPAVERTVGVYAVPEVLESLK